MDLPPLIIVKAGDERYVLVSLTHLSDNNYIDAKIIENSKYLFSSAEWRSDGIHGRPTYHTFLRMSSRSVPKTYNSTLCKSNSYIKVPWHAPIHIFEMTNSTIVLPSSFYKVFTGQDISGRWHFKEIPTLRVGSPEVALTPSAPLAPVEAEVKVEQKQNIPQHIIQGYVESAIQKKEICPITLDPLVMGQIGMTPCGHLFDRSALENVVKSGKGCPQCRSEVRDIVMC
jgi:hypothetical protein